MSSHSGRYVPVELDGTVQGSATLHPLDVFERYPSQARTRVDAEAFKAAMCQLAAGVVMVTTAVDGRPWGLTISACCSLAPDPPELLISLGRHTMSRRAIRRHKRFGVSILSAEQLSIARQGAEAGAPKFIDEHCGPGESDLIDAPMVTGSLCHLVCEVTRVYPQPTHDIFIGQVSKVVLGDGDAAGGPLLYFGREFFSLAAPE
jgi:flavin reductase ActVB